MMIFLLFVLTSPVGFSAPSPSYFRVYHYVKEAKTWAEAQNYCRDVFADLATIPSKAANDRLQGGIQDPGKHAWIGLFDDMVRWKWSYGDAEFIDGKDFSHWKPGEPDDKNSQEGCVVMQFDGLWRDEICDTDRPAICMNENDPSKFVRLPTFMTWSLALEACRTSYTDLAKVTNMTEVDKINKMIDRNHWIGLHRDLWANWSDQSPVTYTNWNTNQPDNEGGAMTSCAAMDTSTGTWFDDDCTKKQAFVCQTLVPPRQRFKLKFKSEVNLNDPAVQQQILQQLHAKLKSNNQIDFKLRWMDEEGQIFKKEKDKS